VIKKLLKWIFFGFVALIIAGLIIEANMTPEEKAARDAKYEAEAKAAKHSELQQAKDAAEKAKAEAEQAKAEAQALKDAKPEPAKVEEKPTTVEESKPTAEEHYKTTATKLYKDYEANEVATDEAIGGRPVEVSGVVEGIDKDMFNNINVTLSTGELFSHASLTLEDDQASKAAKLKKGVKTVIVCKRVTRIMGSPVGSDCTFAQ
jgi:ATPase subunit of ABC transporter with duplicated ATPase domains